MQGVCLLGTLIEVRKERCFRHTCTLISNALCMHLGLCRVPMAHRACTLLEALAGCHCKTWAICADNLQTSHMHDSYNDST